MGLFQRLYVATREAITLPDFDAENKAVEVSASMLREYINLGFGGPGGANHGRLAKPFARGYIFGFSDACIQRFGVVDELELLALITLVHMRIFGHKFGSSLVGDALRDQDNAEFCRGRTAGAGDLFRWLDDRSCTPLLLTRFLQADDAVSCPMAPTDVSPAVSAVEPSNVLTRHAPSRWNNALLRRKKTAKATSDQSATIIPLPPGSHGKAIKPLEH